MGNAHCQNKEENTLEYEGDRHTAPASEKITLFSRIPRQRTAEQTVHSKEQKYIIVVTFFTTCTTAQLFSIVFITFLLFNS